MHYCGVHYLKFALVFFFLTRSHPPLPFSPPPKLSGPAAHTDWRPPTPPQALGIAPQYRQAGYGLMCVAFAKSDLEMELIEEDELYDLQFGDFFNQLATNPNAPNILRDDFALEIADMDE